MVSNVKRPIEFPADTLFDTIRSTELIQKLFLEIFHLVNMVNEIPRKYGHMRDFQEAAPYDRIHIENVTYTIEESSKVREKEKKKRLKDMKKKREMFIKGEISVLERKPARPKNKWWPIDYGWEIDYYW